MNDLIRQGKILYWGTSEWSADQIAEAHAVADSFGGEGPQMEQPEYNMFNRAKVECEFDRLCKTRGLGTTIWSPLASGVLTGKYNQGIPDGSRMTLSGYEWLKKEFESDEGKAKLEKARSLEKLASAVGISMTHLSLLWTLRHENVSTVILGASNSEQLKDNLAALNFRERFSPEVEVQVEEILQNKPEPQRDYL